MKLREKFEESDIIISRQKRVLSQEKIADDFAIGFAEWCGVPIVDANVKELLEIYKKEKGL